MHYKSGIYDDVKDCPADSTKLDHAILAVGYGSENGKDYWIVKNSWSTSWGEEGYIRFARGATPGGVCGLALATSFPKV